jgi:aerobic-type carbon monoxide dehydrogenase small subunit (CoxS/CutS family)
MRKLTPLLLAVAAFFLVSGCEGQPEHTVVIDGRDVDGQTDYTLEVSGTITQIDSSVGGISVSGGDDVSGSTVSGHVGGGADGFRVTGEITSLELTNASAAQVYVDGERHYPEEHTLVISPSDGSTDYTLRIAAGSVEQVTDTLEGRSVTADPSDNVDGNSATGTVDSLADGYRIRGGLPEVDLADPSAATVYLDGREYHTIVVDSRDVDGDTDYTIEVSGSLTQVDTELHGIGVSGGDRVSGNTATGSVGGGADGYRVSGSISSIELTDPAGARVLVDGEPHYTMEHTVVVDGSGSEGESGYTIRAVGTIEQVSDSLAGRAVTAEASDEVSDGTARGTVAGDADGFRIQGGIAGIELADPDAATVYLDGREYHTIVIDGGTLEGSTDYTIEVSGSLEQVDGTLAGFNVSGGDQVSGNRASGSVGGGADGFVVSGTITSIELTDPGGAVVYVDGVKR